MKVYETINAWNGLEAGTKLYGPYPLQASHLLAYFTKENIPADGLPGNNGFFASAAENNPNIFNLIPENKKAS